jgi:hypothetical protein
LTDLCQKWKTRLENPANVTAFGWNQTEISEAEDGGAVVNGGKKTYYSLRYLTKEGARHWSDAREAVIP